MSTPTPVVVPNGEESPDLKEKQRRQTFVQQARTRQKSHRYSIASANFDVGNKGYLCKVEKICRKHHPNPETFNGNYTLDEVKVIATELHEAEEKIENLGKRIMYITAFFIACCAVLAGLMVSANEYSKESHIQKHGINNASTKLISLDGRLVETGKTEAFTSVWNLPLLPSETLANLHHVHIYYETGTRGTYEIVSAETKGIAARLLTADGTVINIDRYYKNLTVNSHGQINTIKATTQEFYKYPFEFFTKDQFKAAHKKNQAQTPATESYAQIAADSETMTVMQPDDNPDICAPDVTDETPSCIKSCFANCTKHCSDFCTCNEVCAEEAKTCGGDSLTMYNNISSFCDLGQDESRLLVELHHSGNRKLFLRRSWNWVKRKVKQWGTYGCCSTNILFVLGLVGDGAACNKDPSRHGKNGANRVLSGYCMEHDNCLYAGGTVNNCHKQGICDIELHNSAKSGGYCSWWDLKCKTYAFAVKTVMADKPNSKPGRCR